MHANAARIEAEVPCEARVDRDERTQLVIAVAARTDELTNSAEASDGHEEHIPVWLLLFSTFYRVIINST